MRLLFVYTNINGFHDDTYAFGIASLVAYVRRLGHETKVHIIRTVEELPGLLPVVKDFAPRVVGFTSVSSQFHIVKELALEIKQAQPEILTILGGVHPTIYPECLLEAPGFDGLFCGESELALGEWLQCLEEGRDYRHVNNFVYLDGGKLVRNTLNPLIADLDSLPPPDREVYPYDQTLKATGLAPFMFSRGCPFQCTYCSNHAIAKMYGLPANYTRMRSPEASIQELEDTLRRFPYITELMIGDDIFGQDKAWRKEFLDMYKARIARPFLCLLRVNVVDEEFIRMLAEAGCKRISFGLESGNDYIRNTVMRRNIKRETIVRAFALARAHGIETNAINIIGLPGETEEMIRDTIRLNQEVRPTITCVNIFFPYRGTQLGDRCYAEGLVDLDKVADFSLERRQSVLRFEPEHLQRIQYYYANWRDLVYPHDYSGRFMRALRKSALWAFLRRVKGVLRSAGLVR